MSTSNITGFTPSTLILGGIPGMEPWHIWFAPPMCAIYMVTLLGNLALLSAIQFVKSLHTPMYLLISLLACSDLVLSSYILPKLLTIFWLNDGETHFSSCLTQMFLIHAFATIESSILSAMAFDRYVAICIPLQYSSIVTNSLIGKLAVAFLCRAIVLVIPFPLLTLRLPFCGRYIPHFFCEHIAVIKLSCADITINNVYGLAVVLLVGVVDISSIALSYALILAAVLRLPPKSRIKAFRTCGTHIGVMSTFHIPILFSLRMHRFQHSIPRYVHIMVVNVYLVLPPIINPFIYGVKMKELRQGVIQLIQRVHPKL